MMEDSQQSAPQGPSFLRSRWKWISLVVVVVMVVTYGTLARQHSKYASSASVEIGPQVFASGAEPLPADMGTAKVLATSSVILDQAAHTLGITTSELQSGLSVKVSPDANVLQFTYEAADPHQAQRGAEAVTKAFMYYQNAELASVQQQLALENRSGHSSSTLSAEATSVIDPASLPTAPGGHKLSVDLVVALIAGLALGIGTALLRDRASDSIRSPADAASVTGGRVLAEIPMLSRRQVPRDPLELIMHDPALRGAFRAMRVSVQDQAETGHGGITLVSRPSRVPSPDLPTAVGLAVSLALSGRSVILVGADMYLHTVNRLVGNDDAVGLVEVLADRTTWNAALVSTSVPGLHVLPEGGDLPGAEELFERERLADLFKTMSRSGADVVVDGPAMGTPESLAVVAACTAVVLEVDIRRIKRTELREAISALSGHEKKFVGVALTRRRFAAWRGSDRRFEPAALHPGHDDPLGDERTERDAFLSGDTPVQRTNGTVSGAGVTVTSTESETVDGAASKREKIHVP